MRTMHADPTTPHDRRTELHINGRHVDLRHFPPGPTGDGYVSLRGRWQVRLDDGWTAAAADGADGRCELNLAELAGNVARMAFIARSEAAEKIRLAEALERRAGLLAKVAQQWLPNHRPGDGPAHRPSVES